MKYLIILLLLPAFAMADDVPTQLQEVSVTIRSGRAEGSGVFHVTKDGQVWVWTCGHVIADLRKVRPVLSGGSEKKLVEFDDAKVLQYITEDGRKVGEHSFDAEVIRYSDSDNGEDLALLRLRTKKFKPTSSVKFYLDKKIPPVGTDAYHCGSLLGELGSNSVTVGIISQHGRIYQGKVYDQVTCTSFKGSSGGIVCLKADGLYIGMIVRGSGEGFNLMVPVRRMRDWSKKVGVAFAMDDTIPVPTEEQLKKMPIEDRPGLDAPDKMPPTDKDFKTLPKIIKDK